MAELTIARVCPKCDGDGVFPNNTMTYEGDVLEPDNPRACDVCSETGRVGRYILDVGDLLDRLSDLETTVDDIMDKCTDIFGKVNE